jgi:hypothetical protein
LILTCPIQALIPKPLLQEAKQDCFRIMLNPFKFPYQFLEPFSSINLFAIMLAKNGSHRKEF